jgi:hypothetical protein
VPCMTRALLTLTLALALLAGCGGGDDGGGGGGGGGDALSKDDFVSQANKICREGEQKITEASKGSQEKVQQAKTTEDQQKVIADVLEDTAKEYDPYLARLNDLNPPQELSAGWDKFIGRVGDAFDLIPELADATRDGDRDKLEELTDTFTKIADDTRPFAQTNALDDCMPDNSGA